MTDLYGIKAAMHDLSSRNRLIRDQKVSNARLKYGYERIASYLDRYSFDQQNIGLLIN